MTEENVIRVFPGVLDCWTGWNHGHLQGITNNTNNSNNRQNVMVDRSTSPVGSCQEWAVLVSPTAVYILFSLLLAIVIQGEFEQTLCLTPLPDDLFYSHFPAPVACFAPRDILAGSIWVCSLPAVLRSHLGQSLCLEKGTAVHLDLNSTVII